MSDAFLGCSTLLLEAEEEEDVAASLPLNFIDAAGEDLSDGVPLLLRDEALFVGGVEFVGACCGRSG